MKSHILCSIRYSIVLLMLCAGSLTAADSTGEKLLVRSYFEPIFKGLSEQLSTYESQYKQDPVAYRDFIDQYIRAHWHAGSTASALIGRDNFRVLDATQRQGLVAAVDATLERYAFEGLEYYGGQHFKLVDVAISASGKMGWLQVLMESPIIPDLNLDILIKRTAQGVWKAVDVRFKGITYVAVKKHQFRKILHKKGSQALIDTLTVKNNDFFATLCSAADKKGDQPC